MRALSFSALCLRLALSASSTTADDSARAVSNRLPIVAVLPNGDFETPDGKDGAKPAFWDKPDGLGVKWAQVPDTGRVGRASGKAICMNTAVSEKDMVAQWRKVGNTKWDVPRPSEDPIAASYGLSLYSDPVQVKTGQAYRVVFDFKGSGGGKVWVRCYGEFAGEKRRRYETFVNCAGGDGDWVTLSQEFHPTKFRPEVTEMRVMLYAYWPPGEYWFDNVRIEPIATEEYEKGMGQDSGAVTRKDAKTRRH